ncbi:MAG: serine hydrolase [Xenococcaceae cyanobacterium MO_188.B19]|nr:serine hydrolase [Xenococcaceae cyanobacterium MO_188.B19]
MHNKHQSESKNTEFNTHKLASELANAWQIIEELKTQNTELEQFINQLKTEQEKKQKLAKKQKNNTRFIAMVAVVSSILLTAIDNFTLHKNSLSTLEPPVSSVNLPSEEKKQIETTVQAEVEPVNPELTYNIKNYAELQQSKKLQKIVDEVVNLAQRKGKPIKPLSISLIDVNTGEFGEYQQEKLRYPASVVKFFWMVMLYAKLQAGEIDDEVLFKTDIEDTIQKSDNESASRILDLITDTRSGTQLEPEDFQEWKANREKVNRFFSSADYKNINLSQKTFPIPYINLYKPKGRDLQIRENPEKPIRNKISTQQASRLMYEIATGQSVSSEYSKKMLNLLAIDSKTRRYKRNLKNPNYFNSVRGFFSQSLPDDVYFAAKAGWTSQTRQETAYITTSDGETAYILTIFAEDKGYAHDWNIFPQLSYLVFKQMTARSQ